ncbi:MAG: beta-ketoacyl synthase N-terminal-like domain-containing protein [Patescibacteria group bacterium]
MKDVFIVGASRSPIASVKRGTDGKKNTSCISSLAPHELAGAVYDNLFSFGIPHTAVDMFRLGSLISQKTEPTSFHAPAKHILMAGRTERKRRINALTLEGACATGLIAIEDATEEIMLGRSDCAIAGGVDMMSRNFDSDVVAVLTSPETGKNMAMLADSKARALGISRYELDLYASQSYSWARYHKNDHGRFIVPIYLSGASTPILTHDEGVDKARSLAMLQKVDPMSGCEIITPAHASKYGDAAAFVALASLEAVKIHGFRPLAIIRSIESYSEGNPESFITAPNGAIQKALLSAGVSIKDVDTFLINEAFAPSPIHFIKTFNIPREMVNPWGGAIACGHPFGATGAVLLVMLLTILLKSESLRFGVVAICAAGGESTACVIERI